LGVALDSRAEGELEIGGKCPRCGGVARIGVTRIGNLERLPALQFVEKAIRDGIPVREYLISMCLFPSLFLSHPRRVGRLPIRGNRRSVAQ
jgi:hypothetical protein